MKKRILSIILSLCMVLALMPTLAFAEDEVQPEWQHNWFFKSYPANSSVKFYCKECKTEICSVYASQLYDLKEGDYEVSKAGKGEWLSSPAVWKYNITLKNPEKFITDPNHRNKVEKTHELMIAIACDGSEKYLGSESAEYNCTCDVTNPTINLLEANKTYCGAVNFTVTDNKTLSSVGYYTTDAQTITPLEKDGEGKYSLAAGIGTVTVVAKDNSGNTAQVTVTVNEGHTWNSGVCSVCDYVCKHNLVNIPAKDATVTETGNKEYWQCKDCKKYFSDADGTKEITDIESWKTGEGLINKLSPEIIEGKGQSITAGEKKELTFTSNAAFSDFIRVELDSKTLDAKNYTVKEGSTVVTLKADYVSTLSAGEHTIGIVSESGTATTTFTVNEKAENSIPQTGDTNFVLVVALIIAAAASLIGIGVGVFSNRKRGLHAK